MRGQRAAGAAAAVSALVAAQVTQETPFPSERLADLPCPCVCDPALSRCSTPRGPCSVPAPRPGAVPAAARRCVAAVSCPGPAAAAAPAPPRSAAPSGRTAAAPPGKERGCSRGILAASWLSRLTLMVLQKM
ncbi:acyl-CoA-binding domain-containing protein 7 isoform X2 [Falco rusticolus]|uniref:acyl-CoA-binding domain-containing protein 7 isoform X2 n=1 Tax=Falco rusticolus TaxID=120794 RepID=UPI0018867D66|nr:acyl-CoA-binding domain-containing protein 7 isoform X2 [Falco rusticolus]XP_055564557.1 acyl-CoA-binding domain-containing protein 7 isoform X2 [Falco cherrug]